MIHLLLLIYPLFYCLAAALMRLMVDSDHSTVGMRYWQGDTNGSVRPSLIALRPADVFSSLFSILMSPNQAALVWLASPKDTSLGEEEGSRWCGGALGRATRKSIHRWWCPGREVPGAVLRVSLLRRQQVARALRRGCVGSDRAVMSSSVCISGDNVICPGGNETKRQRLFLGRA
ncbi:hypothetical protein [Reticulibacter mediterranei]|uniref:hypothetical protein n=1 Tax=Reticulibacter mediterranei TaxID=2778369 RepID=UPI001C693F82|nr:hypothetical protein [Reticulibacter mediterranei]